MVSFAFQCFYCDEDVVIYNCWVYLVLCFTIKVKLKIQN